jgi:hypothetical protein
MDGERKGGRKAAISMIMESFATFVQAFPASVQQLSLGIAKRFVDCFDRVHQPSALAGCHRIGFLLQWVLLRLRCNNGNKVRVLMRQRDGRFKTPKVEKDC